jgi:hypothetical protein
MAQNAVPQQKGYLNPANQNTEAQQGSGGYSFVAIGAWQASSLSYVTLGADVSGNLLVSGGGGGGGSVTQGTTPWIVAGAAGVGLATEATLAKIPGISIPIYDAASLSSGSTTDVWTFRTGGVGGTLVATVTITYTDSTKATISTVVKT